MCNFSILTRYLRGVREWRKRLQNTLWDPPLPKTKKSVDFVAKEVRLRNYIYVISTFSTRFRSSQMEKSQGQLAVHALRFAVFRANCIDVCVGPRFHVAQGAGVFGCVFICLCVRVCLTSSTGL